MSEKSVCFDTDDFEFVAKLIETIDFEEGQEIVITHEKGGNYHIWIGKAEQQ